MSFSLVFFNVVFLTLKQNIGFLRFFKGMYPKSKKTKQQKKNRGSRPDNLGAGIVFFCFCWFLFVFFYHFFLSR